MLQDVFERPDRAIAESDPLNPRSRRGVRELVQDLYPLLGAGPGGRDGHDQVGAAIGAGERDLTRGDSTGGDGIGEGEAVDFGLARPAVADDIGGTGINAVATGPDVGVAAICTVNAVHSCSADDGIVAVAAPERVVLQPADNVVAKSAYSH